MKIFTDEFISYLNETKLAVLSHDEVCNEGSIPNDDLQRLKNYLKDLDREVNEVIDVCENINRVYKAELTNTLTPRNNG